MAEVTELELNRFKFDLGLDTLPEDLTMIYDLWDRAAERYPSSTSDQNLWARILFIRSLKAGAAKLVDYVQNESSVAASQFLDNLLKLEDDFIDQLSENENSGLGVIRSTRKVPKRDVDYPL